MFGSERQKLESHVVLRVPKHQLLEVGDNSEIVSENGKHSKLVANDYIITFAFTCY